LARLYALPWLDLAAVKSRRFTVALDCVRGAGATVMPQLLEDLGCAVHTINLEPDGRFPREPEPIPEHLGELGELVKRTGADIGGEGNGGVILPAVHAGRDAPVAATLALMLLADTGMSVSRIIAAAPRYAIVKAKVARPAGALEPWYDALRSQFEGASADM